MGSPQAFGTNSGMSDSDGELAKSLLDSATLSTSLEDNSAFLGLTQELKAAVAKDPLAADLDRLLANPANQDDKKLNQDFSNHPSHAAGSAFDNPQLFAPQYFLPPVPSQSHRNTPSKSVTDKDPLTGQTLDSGKSTLYGSIGAQDDITFNDKATDPTPPTITAALANDTAEGGTTDTERMTSDPAMGLAAIGLPGFVVRVPDLVMRETRIEQVGNGAATVFWRVENTTDPTIRRGASMNSAWADRLYLSSDNLVSSDDIVLTNPQGQNLFENQPPLAAGGVYTRREQVGFDLATAAAGARPYLLVTTNAIVENLARPREYDDGTASDELQLGSNNTKTLDLRTISQPDAPNQNPYNFQPNGCGESSVAPLNSEVELHSGAGT